MTNPQYKLHATSKAIRRNLIKIFPVIGNDFRIHVIKDGTVEIIDSVEKDIASQLSNLITLGKDYANMVSAFHP